MKTILALSLCLLVLTARAQVTSVSANSAHMAGVTEYHLFFGRALNTLSNEVAITGNLLAVTNITLNLDQHFTWYIAMVVHYQNGTVFTNGWQAVYPATNSAWITTQTAPTPNGPWTDRFSTMQAYNTNGATFYRTKVIPTR